MLNLKPTLNVGTMESVFKKCEPLDTVCWLRARNVVGDKVVHRREFKGKGSSTPWKWGHTFG